jgi:membrane associated rhomboid family serine protease
MNSPTFPRMTPWVGRLIVANAVVQLLLATVLTSERVILALTFSPHLAPREPWTFVSYMFVHAGLLHLATNMLALYMFGAAVENRMGSRTFILYYLYCGIGAAAFSIFLSWVGFPVYTFRGASGAVLGVSLAFAMLWPDAEIMVFPFPFALRARTLVIAFVTIDMLFAWLSAVRVFNDGVAHLAHLGGLLFGYLWFKVPAISQRRPAAQPRQVERVVMVQSATRDHETRAGPPARPASRASDNDPVTAEVDRVLDKISANGISSLTPEERRFLDEVSKRKRDDLN